MKSILTIFIILLCHSYAHTQIIYITTGDGTWTGANWIPSPPPTDLTNTIILINHRIDYPSATNISNWDKSDGSIIISSTGRLDITAINKTITQSNGFTLANDGILNINTGSGRYKIDGEGFLLNGGIMTVIGNKVEFKDRNYNDTTVAAGVQVVNWGTMDFSTTSEVHNDASIENSGLLSASSMHNDGYVCNTNILQFTGELHLHDNNLGMLGCGGQTFVCNIEMEGGKLFNQDICCMSGGSPAPLLIDSSNAVYRTGDVDLSSVEDVCQVILATGIKLFEVSEEAKKLEFSWVVSDVEAGDVFVIERSVDGIDFEGRVEVVASYDASEGTFYAEDQIQAETAYYRLKIINVSGGIMYSSIKSITTEAPQTAYTIYPIPSHEQLTISGEIGANTVVEIVDINGRVVYNKVINSASTIHQINHSLEAGVYSLQIISGTVVASQRIVVE